MILGSEVGIHRGHGVCGRRVGGLVAAQDDPVPLSLGVLHDLCKRASGFGQRYLFEHVIPAERQNENANVAGTESFVEPRQTLGARVTGASAIHDLEVETAFVQVLLEKSRISFTPIFDPKAGREAVAKCDDFGTCIQWRWRRKRRHAGVQIHIR